MFFNCFALNILIFLCFINRFFMSMVRFLRWRTAAAWWFPRGRILCQYGSRRKYAGWSIYQNLDIIYINSCFSL